MGYYEKPLLKLHRILETSLGTAPRGLRTFLRAVPTWMRDKLWIEPQIHDALQAHGIAGEPPGYLDDVIMTRSKLGRLFGGPPRPAETRITQREMDLARSIQDVTEGIVLKIAAHARELTGKRRLCLAGGVALNCVANGRLLRSGIFDDLWIQPAAGDAGSAVGAAYATWHTAFDQPRESDGVHDRMQGTYLGPGFSVSRMREVLEAQECRYETLDEDRAWARRVAALVAEGHVVGLFQGRMELGPRALGNRSIIADPRVPDMQSNPPSGFCLSRRAAFGERLRHVLRERVQDPQRRIHRVGCQWSGDSIHCLLFGCEVPIEVSSGEGRALQLRRGSCSRVGR